MGNQQQLVDEDEDEKYIDEDDDEHDLYIERIRIQNMKLRFELLFLVYSCLVYSLILRRACKSFKCVHWSTFTT